MVEREDDIVTTLLIRWVLAILLAGGFAFELAGTVSPASAKGENSGKGNSGDDDWDDDSYDEDDSYDDDWNDDSGDDSYYEDDSYDDDGSDGSVTPVAEVVAPPAATAVPEITPEPAAVALPDVDAQPVTGTLLVVALRCDGVPSGDEAWASACGSPDAGARFKLEAVDGSLAGWTRSVDTGDDGRHRVKSLEPGSYALDQVGGEWCHAESDNVTGTGDLIIERGTTTTVWLYACVLAVG